MMSDPSILGQKILAFRRDKQLTQKQLAEKSGVSQPLIARIESGMRKDLRTLIAVRIAQALECSLDELAGMKRGCTDEQI